MLSPGGGDRGGREDAVNRSKSHGLSGGGADPQRKRPDLFSRRMTYPQPTILRKRRELGVFLPLFNSNVSHFNKRYIIEYIYLY